MEVKTAHSHIHSEPRSYGDGELNVAVVGKGATSEDAHDMMRMGKT
jgi:hypothetical protein